MAKQRLEAYPRNQEGKRKSVKGKSKSSRGSHSNNNFWEFPIGTVSSTETRPQKFNLSPWQVAA
jgi:hypothetical protein